MPKLDMPFSQRAIDFATCIGVPNASAVSIANHVVAKPVTWLIGTEETKQTVGSFITGSILSRIWGATASAFAALDFIYHLLAAAVKLPFALLKLANVEWVPHSMSFDAIKGNLFNAGQSLTMVFAGSLIGIIQPKQLGHYLYPVSEAGKTPVFGYHEVSDTIKDPWTLSPQLFRKHLEALYEAGYELCSIKEFNEGFVPKSGKKLAVITFDDSHESQFRMLITEEEELTIDPKCAVGVLEEFKRAHPDIHVSATFYINTSEDAGSTGDTPHEVFAACEEQKEFTLQKLIFLHQNGYEIGAHGHKHQPLSRLSPQELRQDILQFDESIQSFKEQAGGALDTLEIVSFAWPHGIHAKGRGKEMIMRRFATISEYGFSGGKTDRRQFNPKSIVRLYAGPNAGFRELL